MSIRAQTRKMLWGRSGNICAFPDCKTDLVMDISETDDISVVGEEAHIVAEKNDGPRGKSDLTLEQRNKYSNLILMCSVHHKIIDEYPNKFPVDTLHEMKKKHELWVKENLKIDSVKQKEDEVYASYVDEFLRLIDVDNYNAWTSYLLGGGQPEISTEQYKKLKELLHYIVSRVWFRRYPELEKAFVNFKNVLNDFLNTFDKYKEKVEDEEEIFIRKFYKIDRYDKELYDKLLRKYNYHVDLVTDLVLELTRAINYLFDKIRSSILPNFRIKEGLLLVQIGPLMDFSWKTYRVEYKQDERTDFPYPGLRNFMEKRSERDVSWGIGVCEDYFPIELY